MYWEPVVKTYGILVRDARVLWSLTLPAEGFLRLPALPAEQHQELELVAARPMEDGRMRLHLLLSTPSPLPPWLEPCDDLQRTAPVAMVYLQGPHFGDRFGIAEAALVALAQDGVMPLVTACTGASLHFAVHQASAAAARRALSNVFVVPANLNRPRSE